MRKTFPRSFSTLSIGSSLSSISSTSSISNFNGAIPPPTQDGLSLLNKVGSKFCSVIKISRGLSPIFSKRILEIRGDILMILNPSKIYGREKNEWIQHDEIQLLVQLSSTQIVQRKSNNTVQFNVMLTKYKIRFSSSSEIENFISILQQASNGKQNSALDESKLSTLPVIGRGATGEVRLIDENKVVKIISKSEVFEKEDMLKQLIYEKLCLQELKGNENVIELHESYQTKNCFCFVTEAAEYGDLQSILNEMEDKKLPIEYVKPIFKQIINGLKHVHDHGMLYRDLKLGNILLNKDGEIKLNDFGLSKPVLKRTSSFVGTRRYMSPELVDPESDSYDASVDIWALGVTLYIMVFGKYPHNFRPNLQNDYSALFFSIMFNDIHIPESTDEDLRGLLNGMLRRDVSERMTLDDILNHRWVTGSEEKKISGKDIIKYLNDNNITGISRKYESDESEDTVEQVNEYDQYSLISYNDETIDESIRQSNESAHKSVNSYLLGFEYMGQF